MSVSRAHRHCRSGGIAVAAAVLAVGSSGCQPEGCAESRHGQSGGQSPAQTATEQSAVQSVSGGAAVGVDRRPPVTLSSPYCTVVADSEHRADAELLAGTLERAAVRLAADYASADADRHLRSASVRVLVASAPNEHCGPGHATNRSEWNQGRCTAEIHVLAPSAHPDPERADSARTAMGEPMDGAYLQRVLVDEYATVLLESICRSKPSGWSFWDAPP